MIVTLEKFFCFLVPTYEYLVRLEGKIRDGIFFCVNKSDNNSVHTLSPCLDGHVDITHVEI